MRATAFLAMAMLLVASAVGATPPLAAAAPSPKPSRVARVSPPVKRALTTTSAPAVESAEPWAAALGAIDVLNRNTNARGKIRLYDDHGEVDRGEARSFMRIAGSGRAAPDDASDDDERLDLRVVQLAMRAAYHFGGASLSIVSATRPGARGKHGTGEALDFALEGVKASVLAAYLRALPRAGVGIYTHPKTQYVHLDVREHSYHWIDASPPGVTWRERLLADPKQAVRDGSWSPRADLPE
ncbi:MAG TPA: hypothetical protein VLT33_20805 [Labilithrix sp.]|nr:hypothetical protein [Labilithrix sp.]